MTYINFGIHATWLDSQKRRWIEFGPWRNDGIYAAICLGPFLTVKREKQHNLRVLRSLGEYASLNK